MVWDVAALCSLHLLPVDWLVGLRRRWAGVCRVLQERPSSRPSQPLDFMTVRPLDETAHPAQPDA